MQIAMGRHHTSLLLILLTFQLDIVSLRASPHTYVPLVRVRAIRDDDVSKNIDAIFQKDYKTTPRDTQRPDELEPSATELVQRAHVPGRTRTKAPIDKNDLNVTLYVERDADGKLVPKFAYPSQTLTTPQPYEQTSDEKYVLKFSNNHYMMGGENETFEEGSFPPDYPFAVIEKILSKNKDKYEELFEQEIKHEQLSTRVDSDSDKYLCGSISRIEYPTRVHNFTIVNYNRFFQSIAYETCTNLNGTCAHGITGEGYKLICEQTRRKHKLFAVPVNPNPTKFDLVEVEYPSCCKCTHVPI